MATERVWVVDTDPVTGEVNRQQAHELLVALEGALWSIGGVVRVAADREPVRDLGGGKQEYRTVRYVFTWDSFAPARRPAQRTETPTGESDNGEYEAFDEQLEAAAEAA